MEIFLADKAGFCFGVKRAINTAYEAAGKGRVYCFGPLIHNPQEVERLRRAGIETIDDFSTLKPGTPSLSDRTGCLPASLTRPAASALRSST